MRKKECFTLVEILATVAITGILMAGTIVALNRVWQNNRIDICESELRDMTAALKSYFTDYGNIIAEPDANYETVIDEVTETLNSRYLPYEIRKEEIDADKKSVRLETKIKADPWGNPYEFDIYTYSGGDADSVPGLVIISSRGPDSISNKEGYAAGEFKDDIIAVVEPKA